MIKAAFFDIDRTLLSHVTNSVPQSARDALEALKRKGVLLFCATGRPKSVVETMPALQGLPFHGCVTLNGQFCYDHTGIIFSNPIHTDDIRQLIAFLDQTPIPCAFIDGNRSYMNFYNDHVFRVHTAVMSDPPPLGDLRQGLYGGVLQIWMYLQNDDLSRLPTLPHIKYTQWHEGGIDMIAMDGGKATGIERVLAHYGISWEEVIAFGDAENDIDMLRGAGIAVAMGNACDAVKAVADFITTDIDDNGISNALKHFDLI